MDKYLMEQLEAMSIPELTDIAHGMDIPAAGKEKRTLIYDIINKQAEDYSIVAAQPKTRRTRIGEGTTADKVYTATTKGRGKTIQPAPLTLEGVKKKRGRPSKADIAAREALMLVEKDDEEKAVWEEEQLASIPVSPITAPAIAPSVDEDLPPMLSEQLNHMEGTKENVDENPETAQEEIAEITDSIKQEVEKVEGKEITDTDFVIVQDLPVYQEYPTPMYADEDNDYPRPKFRKFKDEAALYQSTEMAAIPSSDRFAPKRVRTEQLPVPTLSYSGVLDIQSDGVGFLRSAEFNYLPSPDDVFLSVHQIRQHGLKVGDVIDCTVRIPRENEKYFVLVEVQKINGLTPEQIRDRVGFEHLTPLFPNEKFRLCSGTGDSLSRRIVDLFTPIGKGQRALIVAQPKTGKTMLMKEIANAIAQNNPETYLIMLLIDERPEEVTDMARTVKAEVVASTFDEPAAHHVRIAGLVLEKAKRMVECGHDVVIFLDSITRLARAYNTVAPTSGKVLTGGVDANALQKPKRFFGAARNIEGGGSLTIIATALIDTGSKMDEVIFEEFKGTGNMELQLDRTLANKRIFPAVNLVASSTRRDDLLMEAQTVNRMHILRNFISDMNPMEAIVDVRRRMEATRTNEEFIISMNS